MDRPERWDGQTFRTWKRVPPHRRYGKAANPDFRHPRGTGAELRRPRVSAPFWTCTWETAGHDPTTSARDEAAGGPDESKSTEASRRSPEPWQMSCRRLDRLAVVQRRLSTRNPRRRPTTSNGPIAAHPTAAKKVASSIPTRLRSRARGGRKKAARHATGRCSLSSWRLPSWRRSGSSRCGSGTVALIDPDVIVAGDRTGSPDPAHRLWSASEASRRFQAQLANDHPTAAGPVTGTGRDVQPRAHAWQPVPC